VRGINAPFKALLIALTLLPLAACQLSQPQPEATPARSEAEKRLLRSGELAEDEIWSGEVSVEGELIIPRGISVTVMPGTIVRFKPGTSPPGRIVIYGSLYAQGNPDRPILFTSASPSPREGDWEGLIFTPEGMGSALRSCIFQNYTRIYIGSDNVRIDDCSFSHADEAGLMVARAAPIISRVSVSRCEIGIYCINGARPEINRSSIVLNGYGIVCENGSSPRISNSLIANNRMHGVVCYTGSSPKLASCNIIRNGGWAVYGGGRIVDCFIMGNNKQPPDRVEMNMALSTDQFQRVEEVVNLRSSPVPYAGAGGF